MVMDGDGDGDGDDDSEDDGDGDGDGDEDDHDDGDDGDANAADDDMYNGHVTWWSVAVVAVAASDNAVYCFFY